MAKKSKMTPKQILTFLSIALALMTIGGAGGWKFSTPGEVRADDMEKQHKSDFEVQAQIDVEQDRRLARMELEIPKISEKIGAIKEGQDRIERSIQKMAGD